ncbi:MAG: Asp23/Gls24 family envelope stress response protein, partial [Ruminococcaceae bacterium]|nr:Asp23/Gls24 family envelope stress response protein [Oscillospiraceae bacterium]
STFTDGIVEKIIKKNYNKNIIVEADGKIVSIEIHIVVDFGMKIQPIAVELQETVKRNVENMTDLSVTRVDVCVEGVISEKEPKKNATGKNAANKAK